MCRYHVGVLYARVALDIWGTGVRNDVCFDAIAICVSRGKCDFESDGNCGGRLPPLLNRFVLKLERKHDSKEGILPFSFTCGSSPFRFEFQGHHLFASEFIE